MLLLASEAAQDPALPPQVREDFQVITKNVLLEAQLIDDLLDLTRISRGILSLNLNTVDVHVVLKDAIATVHAELNSKNLKLNLRLAAEPHVLQGDPVRLQQIFWNVLKNAVKFTPERGSVTVETKVFPDLKPLL